MNPITSGRRPLLTFKRSERGASAILVAISALVLMGFAALAIDSGILFSDRRQQQSAADGGGLAAVQFARTEVTAKCPSAAASNLAACRGAEEAIAVVNGTLDNRYSDADWLACTDPAPLPFVSSLSPCITYVDNGLQEARVRLPGTDVKTPFGGVIGMNSASVGAFAHAKVDIGASADVLPFAIGPTGASQAQSCLFAQATSNLDILPCDGNDSGNFGKLDLSLYGNSTLGTPRICGNASPQTKMGVNVATGADHTFEVASKTAGTVNEVSNCPIIPNPVDNIPVQTGNAAQGISDGLFYGVSSPALEGRIMCKDGDAGELAGKTSPACESVWNQFPERLDDTPLWDYINPGNDLGSGACNPLGISDRAGMETCMVEWKTIGSPGNPLFTEAIPTAPRFAAVPVLNADPSGGTGTYDIIDFKPIYIETIYMKCNANSCDTIHSPGESNPTPPGCPNPVTPLTSHCGVPGNGNANAIEALTSFMLDLDMLPDSVADNFPSAPGTTVFNLYK